MPLLWGASAAGVLIRSLRRGHGSDTPYGLRNERKIASRAQARRVRPWARLLLLQFKRHERALDPGATGWIEKLPFGEAVDDQSLTCSSSQRMPVSSRPATVGALPKRPTSTSSFWRKQDRIYQPVANVSQVAATMRASYLPICTLRDFPKALNFHRTAILTCILLVRWASAWSVGAWQVAQAGGGFRCSSATAAWKTFLKAAPTLLVKMKQRLKQTPEVPHIPAVSSRPLVARPCTPVDGAASLAQ